MTPHELVEKLRADRVARAIADMNGDDYDQVPKHKTEWINARGQSRGRFRDVNEPFQVDYDDMARAAIEAHKKALADAGLVIVPRKATEK